jgi:hypothetical protein
MASRISNTDVFINCPFDPQYKRIFYAIVFAVHDAGFRSRCALEGSNATETRIAKIMRIIGECRYGVHDISRTEISSTTRLPRFNMPLELGLFLGAQNYGLAEQKKKCCLILDRVPHRFERFISDIKGQDIYSHERRPDGAIREVRNWLRTESNSAVIPGHEIMCERFKRFTKQRPAICREAGLNPKTLIYDDYVWVVTEWLRKNAM